MIFHPGNILMLVDAKGSDHAESAMRPGDLSESFVEGSIMRLNIRSSVLDWTYSGPITDVLSVEPSEME